MEKHRKALKNLKAKALRGELAPGLIHPSHQVLGTVLDSAHQYRFKGSSKGIVNCKGN